MVVEGEDAREAGMGARGKARDPGRVRFGITFLPGPPSQFVEWCRAVDAAGFDTLGIADSQSLYREVYVSTTLCAVNTQRVRFGPRVINPLTRHPAVAASAAATLEELAPGRTLLGIGTGFSATYNVGLRAATLAQLEAYVRAVRGLLTDGSAEWEGKALRQIWGQCGCRSTSPRPARRRCGWLGRSPTGW
jgi:5,10-methylenetetrahydromethanopterin reductase